MLQRFVMFLARYSFNEPVAHGSVSRMKTVGQIHRLYYLNLEAPDFTNVFSALAEHVFSVRPLALRLCDLQPSRTPAIECICRHP
jgi:hypothetical protein